MVWFGEETRLALLASLLLCCYSLLGVRRARLALALGFLDLGLQFLFFSPYQKKVGSSCALFLCQTEAYSVFMVAVVLLLSCRIQLFHSLCNRIGYR